MCMHDGQEVMLPGEENSKQFVFYFSVVEVDNLFFFPEVLKWKINKQIKRERGKMHLSPLCLVAWLCVGKGTSDKFVRRLQ